MKDIEKSVEGQRKAVRTLRGQKTALKRHWKVNKRRCGVPSDRPPAAAVRPLSLPRAGRSRSCSPWSTQVLKCSEKAVEGQSKVVIRSGRGHGKALKRQWKVDERQGRERQVLRAGPTPTFLTPSVRT